ncbi:8983_t:CDS:10, partial [Scutellospora calospora]
GPGDLEGCLTFKAKSRHNIGPTGRRQSKGWLSSRLKAEPDADNLKGWLSSRLKAEPDDRPDYHLARKWRDEHKPTGPSIHLNNPTFTGNPLVGSINGGTFNLSEESASKRKKDDNNEKDERIKQDYPKKRTRIDEYFPVRDIISQPSNSDVLQSAVPTVMQKKSEHYESEEDNINDFDQEAVYSDNSLYIENICVRSKIMGWRKKSKYIPEIHKQDLLRYNIIDNIESSSSNSRNLFKDIWDRMIDEIEAMLSPTAETAMSGNKKDEQVEEVKTYVKTVVKNVNSYDKLCMTLKSERSNLRTGSNDQWKRRILTIAKALYANAFNDDQTEYHYIITFIYVVFKPLFKDFQHIGLAWGEKSLRCSAILFNNSQQDSDRRNPGSKIDAIIKLLEVDLEFSVVEVSGSPKDHDHNHYIGDRNKIAKSLKIILNYIRMNYQGDFQQFRKIKVYGIQVFNNFFYIYSLSLPFSGVYYFKRELVFKCPTITFLTFRMLPKFLSNLWRMREMIFSSAEDIISYIENADESDHDNELDP